MSKSLLETKMDTVEPSGDARWTVPEAAVEVIAEKIAAVTLGASDAAADPGSNATKAIAVQFVTNGKPLISKPAQYTGVPSSFAILSAEGTVFTLAAGEVGFIQVLSADAPLAVKLGASASTTSFNFILAACTADSDGTGGAVRLDNWVGVVSIAKMAGTSKYVAWKQAA